MSKRDDGIQESVVGELRRLAAALEAAEAGSTEAYEAWNYIANCVEERIGELVAMENELNYYKLRTIVWQTHTPTPLPLRDTFAIHALTGFLASPHWEPTSEGPAGYATASYQVADHMLAVRVKEKPHD